jgi:hypothetical protein
MSVLIYPVRVQEMGIPEIAEAIAYPIDKEVDVIIVGRGGVLWKTSLLQRLRSWHGLSMPLKFPLSQAWATRSTLP